MRYYLLVNPVSGNRSALETAQRVQQLLRETGHAAELETTTSRGDAERRARAAVAAGCDAVVVCGGDGTLQEAATALAGTPVPLGILPRGRCNDFARALGLIRHDAPERLAQIIMAGRTRAVDLGCVGARVFLTVATLGFDSEASRFVETRRLWLRGTAAYLYAVLRVLSYYNFPVVRLRGDFGQYEGRILLVATANSPSYGGAMMIAPGAVPDDGRFHLTLVEQVSRLTVVRMLPRVMQGTHLTHPRVRVLTSSWVEYETPSAPLWVCADGESLCQTPCRFEVRPQALRVLTP
ncbi:MAG: diacylglycerol kinase family lipid kinase [Verrucomicrobiae bacterium]|nr:diacylglycerol kinase family lipid kinase [Verrucomicrobiae bacterium]